MIWNFLTMKQRPFKFFLKFARKSIFLYKFCQMREILNPQFFWYFQNVLLWVIENESFTNRLFSNYGLLNMLLHFFWYLIYSVFQEAFVKKSMKKLSFFNSNFKNPFQDVVYYKKLGYLTLWYWSGGPLNIW